LIPSKTGELEGHNRLIPGTGFARFSLILLTKSTYRDRSEGMSQSTKLNQGNSRRVRPKPCRMNHTPFMIVFALTNLALVAQLKAVDPSDTFFGTGAGGSISSGTNDSAFGTDALNLTTSGSTNTAVGAFALEVNKTGSDNTAVGSDALLQNTASNNTAVGSNALTSNTSGSNNTAAGDAALLANTTGVQNTANGAGALEFNSTGNFNTATGVGALESNSTASNNTADGINTLLKNTTGAANTGLGANALLHNTSGFLNTATGAGSLFANTIGHNNTAIGQEALLHNTSGSNNVALGSNSGLNLTTGSNNIDIGNAGLAGEASTIRIGTSGAHKRTFVAGISGTAVTGVQVVVNSSGQLGVAGSSAHFKEQIKPMDKASEAILALKPVTFRYKEEIDPDRAPQFGLVAEDVDKVDPGLVVHDAAGKPFTVRYEAVNAMLLNEFLKEHHQVQEQDRQLKRQDATIAKQQKQIEALTAGLQKVNDKLELSKPAPQTVINNQ
jgi:hypothetical protein